MEQQGAQNNRLGNTAKELQKWLDEGHGEDSQFKEQAEFVEETVTQWRSGDISANAACTQLYNRYYGTDGEVSEFTSIMLLQAASLWFPYEAGVGSDTTWSIEQSENPY